MKEDLLALYLRKFKTYLIPIVILLISFIAFLQIFLPNIQQIPELNSKIDAKRQQTMELQETYNALVVFDDQDLEQKIQTAELALPSNKVVVDLYLNIITAASKTNVNILKFILRPGTIYEKETKKSQTGASKNFPFFEGTVEYTVVSTEDFKQFARLLQESVPLMEIKEMSLQSTNGKNQLVFFYQPYMISELSKPAKIVPLTEKQQQLLDDILRREGVLDL